MWVTERMSDWSKSLEIVQLNKWSNDNQIIFSQWPIELIYLFKILLKSNEDIQFHRLHTYNWTFDLIMIVCLSAELWIEHGTLNWSPD
jgi:hypothetical protein